MAKIVLVGLIGGMGDYESDIVPARGDVIRVKRGTESELGRFTVDSRIVEHEVDLDGNVVEETWILNVTLHS